MEELKERIKMLEERVKELEQRLGSIPEESKQKRISVREFLDLLVLRTQTDIVVALGYFLEKYEGMNSFSSKELLEGFRLAKERYPANVNSLVNNNIARGLIMPSKEKEGKLKRFELTNSGMTLIKRMLE